MIINKYSLKKTLVISATFLLVGNVFSSYAANIQRANIDSIGTESNHASESPSISSDGRFVAFRSQADNLVAADTNTKQDIFVHDRNTSLTSRVSISTNGTQSNSDSYYKPSLSADGRFVAFSSRASNLVIGDTNNQVDVFVHDRNTAVTSRVSLNTNGTQGNNGSYSPSLSADGRFVTFVSYAENLVATDTNEIGDIFVHDRNTSVTTRVSLSSNGAQSNDHSSTSSLSADGRYVVFSSDATNLINFDINDKSDIFVHDRNTGTTSRVNLSNNGTQGNADSYHPSLSADGRFVAFTSNANNLVTPDTNNELDIFVHDRNASTTSMVSLSTNGTQGDADSYHPSISADGRFVAFTSDANNLVTDDTYGIPDIFVHDRNTGLTSRVSLNKDGIQGNNDSYTPSISADGRFIAFGSFASNLIAADTNAAEDIFVSSSNTPKQDFNADGKADILWRHASTGENHLYMMDNVTVNDSGSINTVSDLNWKIAGSGDFNGDSKTDILWRHATSGQNFIYLMDGVNIVGSGLINTVDDLNWKIAGIGDFDGDDKTDILWRHATSGQNFIYLMDGVNIVGSGLINTVDDLDWKIAGVGDFDGDDKADILWRHASTGFNYLYLMNGTSVKSFAGINTLDDQNWQIKAVADFNSDGKDDILWRHATTGKNHLYMMDGPSVIDSGAINTVDDLNWKIEGANDFNGDGKADILWHHAGTGENYLYIMDGSAIIGSGLINTVTDLNWDIQ